MKREFTAREKGLLLVLVVMILALGYGKLILEPVSREIRVLSEKTLQEQLLLEQQTLQLAKMQQLQKQLEEMKESGSYEAIPAYDNSTAVMEELHGILASARAFTLAPEALQRHDYCVIRPMRLDFSAADYETARSILQALHESAYCSLVTDLQLQWQQNAGIRVSLRITYYEGIG